MSGFDIADKKYQVNSNHSPNKISTWTIPLKSDRWMLCHDAIRGEVSAMARALSAVAERKEENLPDWVVKSIQTWWSHHEAHVKEHCKKEDEILVPFASQRFHWPNCLKEDHESLEHNNWHGRIGVLVKSISGGENVKNLQEAWGEYESKLISHLRNEEEMALPLTRAYFTQEEVLPVGRKMLESEPELTVGAMIHFMGEEHFRSEFMKSQGIPFFVWHVAFKKRYLDYGDKVSSHIDALITGKPPNRKSGWGIF